MKLKALLGVLLLTLSAVVGGSAFGKNDGGCSSQGSWYGFHDWPGGDGLIFFTSQVTGKDESHGITMIDYPGFDATLGGLFTAAVGNTDARGVWKRIGEHTFAQTSILFAVDADGNALYTAKLSNVGTFADDCNVKHISNGTFEFYWPWDNPFDPAVEPFHGPVPARDHDAYRMHVELP